MKSFQFASGARGGFTGRQGFDLSFGVSSQSCAQTRQVHGDHIWLITDPQQLPENTELEADAIITTLKNLPIAVRTADCVPILISHPEGLVACVHAGWRGTHLKILFKTIQKISALGFDPQRLQVAIGPAIGFECFEVGQEVAEQFVNDLFYERPVSEELAIQNRFWVSEPTLKWRLDLKALNAVQAERSGVPKANIQIHPDCTVCSERDFFSYRASSRRGVEELGRNYAWVMRV